MELDMSRFGGEGASTAASGHKTTGIHIKYVCLSRRSLRLAGNTDHDLRCRGFVSIPTPGSRSSPWRRVVSSRSMSNPIGFIPYLGVIKSGMCHGYTRSITRKSRVRLACAEPHLPHVQPEDCCGGSGETAFSSPP